MTVVGAMLSTPKTRKQIARALGSGAIDFLSSSSLEELEAMHQKQPFDLWMVELDATPENAAANIEKAAKLAAGKPLLLLSFSNSHAPIVELLRRNDVTNLISQHGAIRTSVVEFDERELLVTCKKAISGDIFGIEKYIGGWGTKLQSVTVKAMADKAPALEGLEATLRALQVSTTIVPDIVNVADELMLNAIVHAPRGPDGKQKYEHIGPQRGLTLEPSEYVSLVYGCDGQRFMLGVADNFGGLQREALYGYVSKGLTGEQLSPEQKTSGAGLGLTLAFRTIHQLVCNVHEGTRTEVIAGWYLPVANSEFRRMAKSFNLFWLPRSV